jgi:hypothetical protein
MVTVTKTEKRKRARRVRFALSRFIDLQDNELREYRRANGDDPDLAEFHWLYEAKDQMDQLFELVRKQRES